MKIPKKVLAVAVIIMTSPLWADVYTFTPSSPDLSDLPHQYYFTWGVNWALPVGEVITSATLTYKNIWDWTIETDRLYTHLLDAVPDLNGGNLPNYLPVGSGESAYERITIIGSDNQGGGDNYANWSGDHVLLGAWDDPMGGKARGFDLVYNIDSEYFSMLEDGSFGFGIDPDCHYYNDGITLTVTTQVSSPPVPAPAAVGLAAIGLAMVFWGRRFLARSE